MNEQALFEKLSRDGWSIAADPCPHCGCRALQCQVSLVVIYYCVWCGAIGGMVDDTESEAVA